MPTIKKFQVTYKPISDRKAFTNGDIMSGEVTLEVVKNCKIDSLFIKFKGAAEVHWTEKHGQMINVYHSKETYLNASHYFIGDDNGQEEQRLVLQQTDEGLQIYNCVVTPGCHVYPFSFQIPFQNLPSSFCGGDGKIVYLLEAVLSRSTKVDTKHSTKINFVANTDLHTKPWLQMPQHDSKDKKLKLFNSGSVAMDVSLEKMGFLQGEGLKVVAFVKNNSARAIKPKYCLYRKHSFFARGKRKLHTKNILKEVGDPIPPSVEENVTRVITIPHDLEPSILNCRIIRAEYRLRVNLDVRFSSDPEIKFPIVILPAFEFSAPESPLAAAAAAPESPFAAAAATPCGFDPLETSYSSVWGSDSQYSGSSPEPSDPPPPYEDHALYPSVTDFGSD